MLRDGNAWCTDVRQGPVSGRVHAGVSSWIDASVGRWYVSNSFGYGHVSAR